MLRSPGRFAVDVSNTFPLVWTSRSPGNFSSVACGFNCPPLTLSARACRCCRPLDVLGHHHAMWACWSAEASPLEAQPECAVRLVVASMLSRPRHERRTEVTATVSHSFFHGAHLDRHHLRAILSRDGVPAARNSAIPNLWEIMAARGGPRQRSGWQIPRTIGTRSAPRAIRAR